MQSERLCISRILETGRMKQALAAGLDDDHFHKFKQEFKFLKTQYNRYGEVPEAKVFCERFPDFKYRKARNKKDKKVVPLVHAVIENHVAYEFGHSLKSAMEQLDEKDATVLIDEHIERLESIRRIKTIDRDINIIEDVETDIQEVIRLREHREENTSAYIISPWGYVNDIWGGFRAGEAIGIMARLNEGKSWVAGQIATVAAIEGHRVYLASLEMSRFDVAMRIHSMASFYLEKKKYRKGKKKLKLPPIVEKQQIEDLLSGKEIYRNSHLTIGHELLDLENYIEWARALKKVMPKGIVMPDDRQAEPMTLDLLLAKAEREEVDLIVIDYMTLLQDRKGRGESQVEVWERVSKNIKAAARRLGIPIVVCQQSNRNGSNVNSRMTPTVDDSYMSDAFSHNMDRILSLKQLDEILRITNTKNRNGIKNWRFSCHFWPDYGIIEQVRKSIEFGVL